MPPAGLLALGPEDVMVLKRIAAVGTRERRLRFACLGAMTAVVWVLTGMWLPVIWLPLYFALLEGNARLTLALPDRLTGWRLAGFAALLLADSLLFMAMAVHLAAQSGLVFKALALFMLTGYMLNATTDHCEAPLLTAVDVVAVGFAMAVLPLVTLPDIDGSLLAVGAGAAMLWLYFTLSIIGTMRTRQRLRSSIAALTEAKVVETIGRLTGGLARDFGSRVGTMLGHLESALAARDDETRVALLHQAHREATTCAALTGQLVAFAGRAQLRPVALDIVTFLTEVRPRLRRLVPPSVAIEVQAQSTARMVHLDRRQLETVLAELVENARDAMGTSGMVRLVTADLDLDAPMERIGRAALPAGRYLKLSVIDTGSGIPEPILGQVLEPFFTTKSGRSAHGLGLSMAKGFAEQSGGAMSIVSRSGIGTEIALLFPVHVHSRY
jgi:signal transduction histidine kinase